MEDGELSDESCEALAYQRKHNNHSPQKPDSHQDSWKGNVLLKYVKNILSKEECESIIDNDAIMWCSTTPRRKGAGQI